MNVFELGILENIQGIQCGFLDLFFPIITFFGNAGWIWIVIAVALLCFKRTRKAGLAMGIALLLCLALNNGLLKNVVARPRPFEVDSTIKLLISPPSGYSFASGHSVSSFCAATVLLYYEHKRFGWYALTLATLIAFSRLYLRVHYLTDVLAGAVIGIVFGILAIIIIKAIYKRIDNKEQTKLN